MELFHAHKQWAERPADETFDSLDAMHAACVAYRVSAVEASDVPIATLRAEASGEEIMLVGKAGAPARVTNWAFGQLAARADAPAGYLRALPAPLAAQCVNHGLAASVESGDRANLLIHRNGSYVVRALTSDKYDRIWNADITARLLRLVADQPYWHLPLAYSRDPRTEGQMVPRGAYASDHDAFVFLVDTDHPIDGGAGHAMNRGFFVWNSEVGASSFGVMTFLFDHVCGNHIVWGAAGVVEMRVRHVGAAHDRAFRGLAYELRAYAQSSVAGVEADIRKARGIILGANKEKTLDAILSRRIPDLSRKRLSEAYDAAEASPRYGSPGSLWGMVNGITEIAQKTTHTDARMDLDRAAGKLLQIAF